MPQEKIICVNFAQEDAYAQILPRSPLASSYRANWQCVRLDHHLQPAHETPEHSPQQYAIGISLEKQTFSAKRVLNGDTRYESINYGDVAVIPANTYHKFTWDSEVEFLVLSLEEVMFTRALYDSVDLHKLEILPHFATPDPLVHHIGLALKSELESQDKGSRIYIESLATTLCIHILKQYAVSSTKIATQSEGLSNIKLRQAIEYINQNLEKDLTLTEIAAVAGMSIYHFSRLFKQSTGFSPHQYVLNSRIEKSKRLLVKTEEAIDQICQQVGFQSQSHFTNVFRKLIGTTPKAYRKQVKI
ncbi:AraC family transcriptional regulator [Scytonema hofmannii PCC 7110]|uniref:AraC family transcriptional regulator n=1 Tax=Scytonema hofmannii PCC 7110 TaxID=128403 RepID=A0A139X179_9CYAN|nr:helix-turn-helix domain-containing protein [Scytonema hofmannii]KYC38467.1 AraC family transcriptional regulator [Scytonema hofmannii PCC 7110]